MKQSSGSPSIGYEILKIVREVLSMQKLFTNWMDFAQSWILIEIRLRKISKKYSNKLNNVGMRNWHKTDLSVYWFISRGRYFCTVPTVYNYTVLAMRRSFGDMFGMFVSLGIGKQPKMVSTLYSILVTEFL